MPAQLNHTIVWCRDQIKSANFVAQILGLPPPRRFMHFLVVDMANHVSLDYYETTDPVALQHLAFLVSEEEFDAVLPRIRERTPQIWADPARTQPGEINHHFGGRGVYFADPDGHLLEVITQPYGSESEL
jgi:catechol 2,3-dioxygenase-like lactoylglutathione lyase family enzyme